MHFWGEFRYIVHNGFVSPFRVNKFLKFNVTVIMYNVMSVKLTNNCVQIIFVLRSNSLNNRFFVGFNFRCQGKWIIDLHRLTPHVSLYNSYLAFSRRWTKKNAFKHPIPLQLCLGHKGRLLAKFWATVHTWRYRFKLELK